LESQSWRQSGQGKKGRNRNAASKDIDLPASTEQYLEDRTTGPTSENIFRAFFLAPLSSSFVLQPRFFAKDSASLKKASRSGVIRPVHNAPKLSGVKSGKSSALTLDGNSTRG
jgi:hypothetical protein